MAPAALSVTAGSASSRFARPIVATYVCCPYVPGRNQHRLVARAEPLPQQLQFGGQIE